MKASCLSPACAASSGLQRFIQKLHQRIAMSQSRPLQPDLHSHHLRLTAGRKEMMSPRRVMNKEDEWLVGGGGGEVALWMVSRHLCVKRQSIIVWVCRTERWTTWFTMWMMLFGRRNRNYCLKVEQRGDDANCLLFRVKLRECRQKSHLFWH